MKQAYDDNLHLSKDNISRLMEINEIVEEYQNQGYRLTLRQLYYQLVSRDVIPNNVKEYAKLSDILVRGRMAGVVDWDAIEDRIRVPKIPYYVEDIAGALNDTVDQYRLDRLRNQDVYIEVWVEKDALSGVLRRITEKYHVRLMINRGYSSATAMHDAARRFERAADNDKSGELLYLGDHDPSGLDMVHDIKKRLEEFGVMPEVVPIALTDDQIKQYNPPPNPAKITDSRAAKYIAKYGKMSWEVDALKPEVLNTLVEDAIRGLINLEKYQIMLDREKRDIAQIRRLIDLAEVDDEGAEE